MIEEATVDAYGECEQATGWFTVLGDNLDVPFETEVLGVMVTVKRRRRMRGGESRSQERGQRRHHDVLERPVGNRAPRAERCPLSALGVVLVEGRCQLHARASR